MLALGLFGCDSQASDPPAPANTLRIVSSLPDKGYAVAQAKQIEQAIDLAISQRSATSGTWHIEHIALNNSDDETGDWSRPKELANAQQAVNDPSVMAYIGPYQSGATMIALPITNKAGLLQASPSATWPGLTQSGWNPGEPDIYYPTGKRNFIRMMPPDNLQADAAVQWVLRLNLKHLALLTDGSSYSTGLAKEFQAFATRNGLITAEPITITPPNLNGLSSKLTGVDAVFYAPSNVMFAVAVAKVLSPGNINVFASDTALSPQFATDAGTNAQNWHIISNSADFSDTIDYGAFEQLFKARYFAGPDQFAANTYSLTNLILDKLTTTGNNRASLIAALLPPDTATFSYKGPTGQVVVAVATGDPTTWHMSGFQLEEGIFKPAGIFQGQVTP